MSDKDIMLKLITAPDAVKRKVADLLDGRAEAAKPDAPQTAAEDRRLVTVTDAAKLLGVSRPTVYALAKRGDLDVVRLCGVRRISMRSIDRYLAQFQGKGWR